MKAFVNMELHDFLCFRMEDKVMAEENTLCCDCGISLSTIP